MNEKFFVDSIGGIDDELITESDKVVMKKKSNVKLSLVFVAAALVSVSLCGAVTMSMRKKDSAKTTPVSDTVSPVTDEACAESRYIYTVDSGEYASYIGTKVIPENMISEKVGEKLADVTVTAGWHGYENSEEHLNGVIYGINGISEKIGVCIKFTDKGEALTTTHYYVMYNPDADISPLYEIIGEPAENASDDGIIEAVTE